MQPPFLTHLPLFFFVHDTATTKIYTLSLHDALPIYAHSNSHRSAGPSRRLRHLSGKHLAELRDCPRPRGQLDRDRSEEHTSELQSRQYLVCRLLLEKKKKTITKKKMNRSRYNS